MSGNDRHAHFVAVWLRPAWLESEQEAPRAVERLDSLLDEDVASSARTADGPCMWLLRGDPGAGKSTVLLDLELRRAHAACARWQLAPDARPELCLYFSLAGMPVLHTAGDLDRWLEDRWDDETRRAFADGKEHVSLQEVHRRARVRYLLDGVNEVEGPPGRLRRIVNLLADWGSKQVAAGRPGPVFSVRSLDHVSFPLAAGLSMTRVIDIEPWGEAAVRDYCDLRFPGQGNPLWRAIDGHPQRRALVALFSNPFNLALQCTLCERQGSVGELRADRAQLMGRLGLLRLDAALRSSEPALAAHDLIWRGGAVGDEQRVSAACEANRSLHEVPLRGRLVSTLEAIAFEQHAQGRGAWNRWPEGGSVAELGPGEWEPACKAASALHLMRWAMPSGEGDWVGEWRFTHQLWQEYLAASALMKNPELWSAIDLRAATEQPDRCGWELPAPPVLFWDQAVQLAVQMAPTAMAEAMLQRILTENLALAGRAAVSRSGQVGGATLERLKRDLLNTSRSEDGLSAEARIEAGLLLGQLGDDLRFDKRHSAQGVAYCVPKSTGWIQIPAPPGTRGDAPPASMAFAPVTNAEFACFVADGGYGGADDSEPPMWWQGEFAIQWWRGEASRDSVAQQLRRWRAHWGRPGWNALRASELSNWSEDDIERVIEPLMRLDQDAFDANVDARSAPQRSRQPDAWRQLRLTNPLQPVVGVNVWEALAYCRWLSARAALPGLYFRLPTDAEWGAMAGASCPRLGRHTVSDTNCLDLRVRRAAPIGVFPGSDTPDGVVDLFGQVWEWLQPTGGQTGWTRGGSWDCPAAACNPEARKTFSLIDREDDLGFRLVRAPVVPDSAGRVSRTAALSPPF